MRNGFQESLISFASSQERLWFALAGNAGCDGYHSCYFHLINAGKSKLTKGLPRKVNSLDENFLLIRSERMPAISSQLSGYHLYGTDICINAIDAGNNCYVIPFLVEHLSLGNLKDLEKFIPDFVTTHSNQATGKFIQTTCTKFYLGNSPAQSKFYNSGFMFELVKFWQRIKQMSPRKS